MAHHHANPTGAYGGGSSSSSSTGMPPLHPDADVGQVHQPSKVSTKLTTVIAGVIVLIKKSPTNLSMEISWVIMFLASQQMCITSNAITLLLQCCLELLSDSDSDPAASMSTNANVDAVAEGLGLHHIQEFMHAENEASR
jgi:hypothetical protein